MKSLSRVWLLGTPWTAAYQAPPSMGFSRQEYWSGVPLPSPWYSVKFVIFICIILVCFFHLSYLAFIFECIKRLLGSKSNLPNVFRRGTPASCSLYSVPTHCLSLTTVLSFLFILPLPPKLRIYIHLLSIAVGLRFAALNDKHILLHSFCASEIQEGLR